MIAAGSMAAREKTSTPDPVRISHEERANIRIAAVSEAIATKDIPGTAKKYGKSKDWLINALKSLTSPEIWRNVIPEPQKPLGPKGAMKVVAALIHGAQESMVAARFNISREWVNQIKKMFVESGLRDAVEAAVKAGGIGGKGMEEAWLREAAKSAAKK